MKNFKLSFILLTLVLLTTSCINFVSVSSPSKELEEPTPPEEIVTPAAPKVVKEVKKDDHFIVKNYVKEDKFTRVFKNCFKTGKKDLQKSCKKDLNSFLQKTPLRNKRVIIIEVHTDKGGSAKNNLAISKKRAYSAAASLYYKEYKHSQVYYTGFGESRVIYDTRSAKADFENRRLVVMLREKNEVINKKEFKKFVYRKKSTKVKPISVKVTAVKVKPLTKVKTKPKVKTKKKVKSTPKKEKLFTNIKLLKYTGKADTGWIYFGKKDLKEKFLISCADDKPRKVKRKAISKSKKRDFVSGLYGKRISGNYADNYMEIYPVYINEKGYLPRSNPIVTVYSDDRKVKRYQTTVNTYRGKRGILYRIFVNGKKNMECMDLVISYTTKEVSYGQVYVKENDKLKRFKFTAE